MKNEKQDLIAKLKKYPPEAYIICIILMYTTVIMTMEVVGRYVFGKSFSWSEEIVRYSFVWFTMLGASYAVREKANICVDGVLKKLPPALASVIEVIGQAICIVFMVYLTYVSFRYTSFIFATKSMATVTKVPMGYIYSAIPVGFFLISVRMIVDALKRMIAFGRTKRGGDDE